MKKIYLALAMGTLVSGLATAQKSLTTNNPANFFEKVSYRGAFGTGAIADWTKGWSNWDPNNAIYPNDPGAVVLPEVHYTLDITSDVTWTPSNVYYIDAPIHVTNGVTLTIQPGTVGA